MKKPNRISEEMKQGSNGSRNPPRPNQPLTELPKGVAADLALPNATLGQFWSKIKLNDERQKDRILAMALLSFTLRLKVDFASLPMHGFILLVGPPGTGKTSLAKGLAHRIAESFPSNGKFRYLEIDPHALANSGLGRSQQSVRKLLSELIPERLAAGPLIVLLDEVETLATDRSKLSLEANPVDVHRSTDAVLASLDQLTSNHPNLLFIATSNFAEAIDPALISRADLVEQIALPNRETAEAILRDAVHALSLNFSAAKHILGSPEFAQAAEACHGLDGRQIRKTVILACAMSKETALDPGQLKIEDIIRAAEISKSSQNEGKRA